MKWSFKRLLLVTPTSVYVAILLFGSIGFMWLNSLYGDYLISNCSRTVGALVYEYNRTNTGKRNSKLAARYIYMVNGEKFKYSNPVPKELRHLTGVGDSILIEYACEDPSRARIVSYDTQKINKNK